MTLNRRLAASLIALLACAACETPNGPGGPLQLTAEVSAPIVRSDEVLTVTVTLRNASDRARRLEPACGMLDVAASSSGARPPAVTQACDDGGEPIVLAPGETRVGEWRLVWPVYFDRWAPGPYEIRAVWLAAEGDTLLVSPPAEFELRCLDPTWPAC